MRKTIFYHIISLILRTGLVLFIYYLILAYGKVIDSGVLKE